MLYKVWRAIAKENLLLSRDLGGLLTIFLMPLVLIITVTLIQDSTFRDYRKTRVPVLFIDEDKGEISSILRSELKNHESLMLVEGNFAPNDAETKVFAGEYQLGIVLPKGLSSQLNSSIETKVNSILQSMGVGEESANNLPTSTATKEILFYFDPAATPLFKSNTLNTINRLVVDIENKKIYEAFQAQLGGGDVLNRKEKIIAYREVLPNGGEEHQPNAVQHNVPAWTLVAMFFIAVPLCVNIVKEKNEGTALRMMSSPTPYFVHLLGKTVAYLCICVLQFAMMLCVGAYVFPWVGLSAFEVGDNFFDLGIITLCAGLAAVGFGLLVGTFAKTQEQGAPFGATGVIVLSALGGVFVPVFLMPEFMQKIARISPLNWGLQAYQDILLRKLSLGDTAPYLLCLVLFYCISLIICIVYDRKRFTA